MALFVAGGLIAAAAAQAQNPPGPGVADREITIGQSSPFSGPASGAKAE
jgi:hypothetical protein